jgi:hypothetical protein
VDELLGEWQASQTDSTEQVRRLLDLFLVSVLLDAGAGDQWYIDYAERCRKPSESIGSFPKGLVRMRPVAQKGWHWHLLLFSVADSSLHCPIVLIKSMVSLSNYACQLSISSWMSVAVGLSQLSLDQLAQVMQVHPTENPLVGLEGRWQLLRRLGEALQHHSKSYFSPDSSGDPVSRPGHMFDYLLKGSGKSSNGSISIQIDQLWDVMMHGISSIWPATRTQLDGRSLGDVWPCQALRAAEKPSLSGEDLVPFHKLSQWLTYSLMEPMTIVGKVQLLGLEKMTGLAEYRNGGLLVDSGALVLKEEDYKRGMERARQSCGTSADSDNELVPLFDVWDPVIVEWYIRGHL